MDTKINFRSVDLVKDIKRVASLTQQAVKFSRFVISKDIFDYSLYFALRSFLSATYCIGAYIDDELIGFITCDFKNKNKIYQSQELLTLNETLKKKFDDYMFLEDTKIYGNVCHDLLAKENDVFDGEITLFVVDQKNRGLGVGKQLLLQALDYYQKEQASKIFLTSDSECNYHYYEKFGFVITQTDIVPYAQEKVEVFIEVKRF